MQLSIVTTLYRSAPYIEEFHRRASAVAERAGLTWELVMVNDGSPDDSLAHAIALSERDPRVVVVDLSRNFGHHKAMMTGLAHARGELVFLLDVDLEEAPEWFDEFRPILQEKRADVVFGVQDERKGAFFERVSGAIFWAGFNWLSSHPIPQNMVTARLMTRRYVDALLRFREREVMLGGVWVITGFEQIAHPVHKLSLSPSSYTLSKKVEMLIDAVTSFSNKPLILIFYIGSGITAAGATGAVIEVVRLLFFEDLLPGWTSLIVSIWLLGGINIFCVGLLGLYLSKIFVESKQRPYTIVRQVYGGAGVPPAERVVEASTVPD